MKTTHTPPIPTPPHFTTRDQLYAKLEEMSPPDKQRLLDTLTNAKQANVSGDLLIEWLKPMVAAAQITPNTWNGMTPGEALDGC